MFHVYQLEDRIIQFLIGLDGDYQIVASQFLFMELMPLINKVFSMVKQQGRKMQYGLSPKAEGGVLMSIEDVSKTPRQREMDQKQQCS